MTVLAAAKTSPEDLVSFTIPRMWEGETVVCIASGPSLTENDVYIAGQLGRVIAVNDNYRLAPQADMLYACDKKWWDWHYASVRDNYHGKWCVTQDPQAKLAYPDLTWVRSEAGTGLSQQQDVIHQGQNSGYQAINIAALTGASRIVLLGYDMKTAGNGLTHWFGEHPTPVASCYKGWLPQFDGLANDAVDRGIRIINCSRDTDLNAFIKVPLEDLLYEDLM